MEKVQKTPTQITEVGQPDQYGNKSYSVLFNDNTSGFFRCHNQNLFTVNEPATFYYGKAVGKSGSEYYKIERVEKHEKEFQKSSQSNVKPANEEQINRSVAIKAACQLFQGEAVDPEYVLETADVFFDYIRLGIVDKKETQVVTDKLPF